MKRYRIYSKTGSRSAGSPREGEPVMSVKLLGDPTTPDRLDGPDSLQRALDRFVLVSCAILYDDAGIASQLGCRRLN